MKKIGIIGGGFSGAMTAVNLINKINQPCEIVIINQGINLNRGIAYTPYSDKHILNVTTGKMSAFPNEPDHFLNWVMQKAPYCTTDRTLISNSFLSRRLYGEYLSEVWKKAKRRAKEKQIKLVIIHQMVSELNVEERTVDLLLNNNAKLNLDYCVLATGNQLPRNPRIKNPDFYNSSKYFQNPWKIESVLDVQESLPLLIIGNGLTMVDTVFGLIENGFKGTIYSISPNGFNILPHRHSGLKYSKLIEELQLDTITLLQLVHLVNKHIKTVREYGVSAEPVIDSLRPYTQQIWKSFSDQEKKIFLSRLRHLWGVARHRIPLHSYDKIQELRINGSLKIESGKLINLKEDAQSIAVEYLDKKDNALKTIHVSRVINCTGPETDLLKLNDHFLNGCLKKGILIQDQLKLGIRANTNTYQVLDDNEKPHNNLFTIGSNLRGELWESTAINELRQQAEQLADRLTELILENN